MHRASGVFAIVLFSCVGMIHTFAPSKKAGCTDLKEVSCRCGKAETLVRIKVKSCPITYKGTIGTHCEPCQEDAIAKCKEFKECDTCKEDEDGPICIRSMKKKQKFANENDTRYYSTGYPITVKTPAGVDDEKRRIPRDILQDCEYQFKFPTAEVKCWIWPDYVKCEQTCVHGYEIDGGKSRIAKCKSKNPHEWYPKPLEDCQPVHKCRPKLVTPGEMKCHIYTMGPPFCTISCESYDRNPSLARRTYHCDETFDPPLPHCAEVQGNFEDVEKETAKPED